MKAKKTLYVIDVQSGEIHEFQKPLQRQERIFINSIKLKARITC
jgi:hypothetical protein